jgi:hypothetical protein
MPLESSRTRFKPSSQHSALLRHSKSFLHGPTLFSSCLPLIIICVSHRVQTVDGGYRGAILVRCYSLAFPRIFPCAYLLGRLPWMPFTTGHCMPHNTHPIPIGYLVMYPSLYSPCSFPKMSTSPLADLLLASQFNPPSFYCF